MKGQVFGSLTVLKYEDTGSNGARWECLCECGKHKVVDGYLLRRGTIKTCGCRININKNLVGKRFGKLLVIKEAGRHKDRTNWNAKYSQRRGYKLRRCGNADKRQRC